MSDGRKGTLARVGTAVAMIGGFLGLSTPLLAVWVGTQDAELKRLAEQRAERQGDADLAMKLYDQVQAVLTSKEAAEDPRVVLATSTLVRHLARNPEYRDGLLAVLQDGAGSAEARAANAQVIEAVQLDDAARVKTAELGARVTQVEEAAANVSAERPRWLNWDVDFFYCDAQPGAQEAAERSLTTVKTVDPEASGRWRVRVLTRERNASPAYNLTRDEVRYDFDSDAEFALATALRAQLEQQTGRGFVLRPSQQGTPWYLSAFFCSGTVVEQ